MSYCVNCGVELSNNEKKCPLCGTEVYHPDPKNNRVRTGSDEPPYPQYKPLTIQRVSRSSVATLVTLLFLLPILLSIICNISIDNTISWSAYVTAAVLFAYICLILPILMKKPDPVFCIIIDACALIFLLMFVEKRAGGTWFMPFALPLSIYISAVVIALSLLGHRHFISGMKVTALTFIATGICSLFIEILLNTVFGIRDKLVWSFYPLIVLTIIGAALFIIDSNKPLKERLAKKFFI